MKKYPSLSDITVNWHFIDLCNMKCRFCFANKNCQKIKFDYKTMLDHLQVFRRVNFVGGEPTISKQFPSIVSYAQNIGLKTSIVTNGFNITKKHHLFNAFLNMSTVGLSIDSLSRNTNIHLGRSVNNNTLSINDAIK